MQYSDSDKRMTPVESAYKSKKHLPNDYSQDSKSFYTDFSGASLPKTASAIALQATPSSGILNPKQIQMTKCLAACLRYKSRRVANCFWRWKYQAPSMPQFVGVGKSTIHGATQQTAMDADSEVADLI